MTRLFRRYSTNATAASGTLVSSIQLALNAVDNADIDVDGAYGGQTTTALSIYQSHLGLPGNVYLARVDVRSVAPDLGGLELFACRHAVAATNELCLIRKKKPMRKEFLTAMALEPLL